MSVEKMGRFTDEARKSLVIAKAICEGLKNPLIEPTHLITALAQIPDSDAYYALNEFDIINTKLMPLLKQKYPPLPDNQIPSHLELSPDFKRTLELSVDAARRKGFHVIGTGQLLIGMLRAEFETIDEILIHFDVQAKDLIKASESYTDEIVRYTEVFLQAQNTEAVGCFSAIARLFGMSDDGKQD